MALGQKGFRSLLLMEDQTGCNEEPRLGLVGPWGKDCLAIFGVHEQQ